MRQFVAPLAVAAFIALFGTSSWAKTMTVKGQVVDEGCSLREMGQNGGDTKAAEMDQCAIDCARRGEPVALLTAACDLRLAEDERWPDGCRKRPRCADDAVRPLAFLRGMQ